MISCIVSVDNNWGIGSDNDLVVRNPMDLLWFKGFTFGKTLIVGYNTYNSLPPLKHRELVLDPRGKHDYAIELITKRDVVIIGGAKTYRKYAHAVEELLITFNDIIVSHADTFFAASAYDHLKTREIVHRGKYGDMPFRIERWTK